MSEGTLDQLEEDIEGTEELLREWIQLSQNSDQELDGKRRGLETLSQQLAQASHNSSSSLQAVTASADAAGANLNTRLQSIQTQLQTDTSSYAQAEEQRRQSLAASDQQLQAWLAQEQSCRQSLAGQQQALQADSAAELQSLEQQTNLAEGLRSLAASLDDDIQAALKSAAQGCSDKTQEGLQNLQHHAEALSHHHQQLLPQEFGRVHNWVSQEILNLHLSSLSGAQVSSDQHYQTFSGAVAQLSQQHLVDVQQSLVQAGSSLADEAKKLQTRLTKVSSPALSAIQQRQRTTQQNLQAGADNTNKCARELVEFRHKYDILAANL